MVMNNETHEEQQQEEEEEEEDDIFARAEKEDICKSDNCCRVTSRSCG